VLVPRWLGNVSENENGPRGFGPYVDGGKAEKGVKVEVAVIGAERNYKGTDVWPAN